MSYIRETSAFDEAARDVLPVANAPAAHEVAELPVTAELSAELETLYATRELVWTSPRNSVNAVEYRILSLHGNNHENPTFDPYLRKTSERWGYHDDLSFIRPHALRYAPKLRELLSDFTLLPFKARLGRMESSLRQRLPIRRHQDTDVFEEIHLTVTFASSAGIFLCLEKPEGIEKRELRAGQVLWYDGGRYPHSIEASAPNSTRTNLTFGLSPWVSFNEEGQFYYLNEHFGKSHPIDLVLRGMLLKGRAADGAAADRT